MLAHIGRIVLFASCSLSSQIGLADFLPPNNLNLEDQIEAESGISEAEFNRVIDQALAIYEPIVKAHNAKIVVNRNWSNSTVNASATRFLGTWTVSMYGGLARRPEITADGFALVLCHEIGHHLGGFPFATGWAANEGEADYFATASCARLLWSNEADNNALAAQEIPDFPRQLCETTYFAQGVSRVNLCYREMMASLSTASLLATLGGTAVEFDKPDTSKVSSTYSGHPEGQCRLDTYMQATLCPTTFDSTIIPRNEREAAAASCHTSKGDKLGNRPQCWFKPAL